MIKVVRTNGITLAKRRCSEFRQLLIALKAEMPKIYFPELPPPKSTGSNLPLQEKRDMLQNLLDCFWAQKIYNKEVHKFLSPEHQVPVYLKKISKRAAKKGKVQITAAPCSSILVPSENDKPTDIRDSMIMNEGINMDTLQQRYTTKYEAHLESVASVGISEGKSTIKEETNTTSVKGGDLIVTRQSEINLEELKTGLMDAMTFMVRVTDTKMLGNKFVPIFCTFGNIKKIVLYILYKLQRSIW